MAVPKRRTSKRKKRARNTHKIAPAINIQAKTGKGPDDFRRLADEKGFMSGGKLRADIKAGQVTAWLKEVGPSTELRQWFNHDPLKWSRFRARYFRELDSRPESWQPIRAAARRGTVTLVYSSHDEKHNNAVALKEYLRANR